LLSKVFFTPQDLVGIVPREQQQVVGRVIAKSNCCGQVGY